ncbi:MAG: type II toxin-antitoxin system VapC family toxin [Propionibacteriaceae bacterium]
MTTAGEMAVVDASIVVRLLQNRRDDAELRERFGQQRYVYAPALIDAEVTSAIRGLVMTSKPAIQITVERAEQMLDDFADLPLVRYPMQPYQRRVLAVRQNFTAYEAFYLALSESLDLPLLTDDRKFGKAPAQTAVIETWT